MLKRSQYLLIILYIWNGNWEMCEAHKHTYYPSGTWHHISCGLWELPLCICERMSEKSTWSCSIVTDNGVLLLAAQKPKKRPSWWKEKFTLFWMSATAVGVGDGRSGEMIHLSKDQYLPHFFYNQWTRVFVGLGRELHAETAQSALTVILKLIIGGLTSVISFILSTDNL